MDLSDSDLERQSIPRLVRLDGEDANGVDFQCWPDVVKGVMVKGAYD